MKDKDIIDLIRQGKEDRVFVKLYSYQKPVIKLIKSKGGTTEDAQDIFQEALLILHQKCQDTSFELTSSINTYLYGVSRFLWKNQQRKKGVLINDSKSENIEDQEEDLFSYMEQEQKNQLAELAIEKLGENVKIY